MEATTSNRSRSSRVLIVAAVILIAAIPLIVLARKKQAEGQGAGPAGDVPGAVGTAGPGANPAAGAPKRAPKEPLPAIDPAKTNEQLTTEIWELSAQYDPAAVKPLAAYLYHSDPDIRDKAREGLMQLGEKDAVPLLREAAKSELDPEESKKLTEAADFLALPPLDPVKFGAKHSAKKNPGVPPAQKETRPDDEVPPGERQ